MTPWTNEGFFAKVAVLVEGEDEQSCCPRDGGSGNGHDFEGSGHLGHTLQRKDQSGSPAAIFRNLGIQVYVVWDGDKKGRPDGKPEINRRLLRSGGREPEDWPAGVWDTHS